MYYIYCYTNKINGHKYVGQTNNLQRRIREHKSCAFNPNASSYNDLIHQKIRQYGIDNFEITVLEKIYTEDISIINEKEQYWVDKLISFRGFGQGYNSDKGGGNRSYNSILTPEQIQNLKQDIKNGIAYIDLQSKYNISTSFISSINNGIYFFDKKEEYPLYKYYKSNEDYDDLIDLLLNSTYSLARIAELLNISYSTVKKINAGTMRKDLYPNYPIRKKSANEQRANKIKELLMTTDLSNKEIGQIVNAHEETVRRIKIGESFYDKSLKYPLQNL